MNRDLLPDDARAALERYPSVDIVIGIPSYNNARTIGHVVHAAHAGLSKYFPQFTGLIVNSDGGSSDRTRETVLTSQPPDSQLLMLATPFKPVHRLSVPYHGIPGKGSAFRLIFEIAVRLNAKACAVVDSDLRSITPEWIDLLLRPVVHGGYDFVAPYYHRHKYDGTITNSIIYPLTRALYGKRVRQPIGGDFGMSIPMLARYLSRQDWETDVARYGIDIWMTTIALAENFRVCQSFLGAKLHDAKDPGADLSAMLRQVVGSVFSLMQEYEHTWPQVTGSAPVDLFGFRYDVGLDPIDVKLERMLNAFRQGADDLRELWALALTPETLKEVIAASKWTGDSAKFLFEDGLWVRLLYEFACAHRNRPLDRNHLLKSLTPLYLARVASFVNETIEMGAAEVEQRIETLCKEFESRKPELIELWPAQDNPETAPPARAPVAGKEQQERLEAS